MVKAAEWYLKKNAFSVEKFVKDNEEIREQISKDDTEQKLLKTDQIKCYF